MLTRAKRFTKVALVALVAVLFSVFAIVNRDMVSISLFPLPYTADMPKFILVIACFALGLLAGWLAVGMSGARHKRELKAQQRHVAALRNEVSALHAEQRDNVPAIFSK